MTELDDPLLQLKLIYAGGLAHGALLRVRELLADGRVDRALEVIDENLAAIRRAVSGEDPPARETAAPDESGKA